MVARVLLFRGSIYLLFEIYVFLKLLVRNVSLILLAHLKHLLILRAAGLRLNHNGFPFSPDFHPPDFGQSTFFSVGWGSEELVKEALPEERQAPWILPWPASWFSLKALWVLGNH